MFGLSAPRAIGITLVVSMALYGSVAFVTVGAVGAESLASLTESVAAPLVRIAEGFACPGLPWLVALGAVTAMLGVLLNLVLGLSRGAATHRACSRTVAHRETRCCSRAPSSRRSCSRGASA